MKKWFLMALALFMLTACNDKNDVSLNEKDEVESIGFEVLDEKIQRAENIPIDEESAIIAAFNEYIEAFNAKDLDRYVETLSKNPQGFELDEDIETVQTAFNQYDIVRIPSDTTIVKYSEEEAQVFANLNIEMTEIETKAEYESNGRQVTVFVKEDGSWKVTSVYYIGNES